MNKIHHHKKLHNNHHHSNRTHITHKEILTSHKPLIRQIIQIHPYIPIIINNHPSNKRN